MGQVTIGYVSGAIAAAVFIVHFLVPNLLSLILVGTLKNEHSAVTWSVVNRDLLASQWPWFLSADSAASRGVNRTVRIASYFKLFMTVLITAAAVVTPLGLYEAVVPAKNPVSLRFIAIPDTGPVGAGTPSRGTLEFSRLCGLSYPVQCPGTSVSINVTIGGGWRNTSWDGTLDSRIPTSLAEVYQSGLKTQPRTVSSFFDIQTRQYTFQKNQHYNNNSRYVVDIVRPVASLILNNALEPVEGLVVDTVNGSIGFRNHTVPADAVLGAEWQEELLFLEPEVQCVNTNLSLEFRVPYQSYLTYDTVQNLSLVDHGGFANLNRTYPALALQKSQDDPALQARAYKAAWLLNSYTMLLLNVTRPAPNAFGYLKSTVGTKFPLNERQYRLDLQGILMTGSWTSLLTPPTFRNTSLFETSTPNPFNLTNSNYTTIRTLCHGAGSDDLANMNNIHVECGLFFGAATRLDGSKSFLLEPDTWWTRSVHTCASTVKASIKTVSFRYNTTATTGFNLKALSVTNITAVTYLDETTMPLWGTETVNMRISDLTQLWGLIASDKQNVVNITTRRSPHLYLPGYSSPVISLGTAGTEFVPGNTGPAEALVQTFGGTSTTVASSYAYSGASNTAMFTRWQELSKQEGGIPKIAKLIWTDIAANSLIGTRGQNTPFDLPPNLQKREDSSSSNQDSNQPLVPVTTYERRILYRWPFAIPAFIVLTLCLIIIVTATVMSVTGKGSATRIRYYLDELSAGRLLGSIQYPHDCDRVAPTNEWITRVGKKPSDLGRVDSLHHNTKNIISPSNIASSNHTDEEDTKFSVAFTRKPVPGYTQVVGNNTPQSHDSTQKSYYDINATELKPITLSPNGDPQNQDWHINSAPTEHNSNSSLHSRSSQSRWLGGSGLGVPGTTTSPSRGQYVRVDEQSPEIRGDVGHGR